MIWRKGTDRVWQYVEVSTSRVVMSVAELGTEDFPKTYAIGNQNWAQELWYKMVQNDSRDPSFVTLEAAQREAERLYAKQGI